MGTHDAERGMARYGARKMRLALDWDGTVTERDTLHMVIERFGDLGVFRRMEAELGQRLTLQEVIRVEMATIRTPLADVVEWVVREVMVRPGFARLIEHDPLIVSAGFHELIEPVLAREGVRARVVANRLADGSDGLEARFTSEARCAVCDEACKRGAIAELGRFAYAGDGISDRCVALAADRVFARDGLARWLGERGTPYEPFDTLDDICEAMRPDSERTAGDGRGGGPPPAHAAY